uniref:Protein MNN4-like n=1 Tax=Cucumis melo TaxID=3656 RepID=A0A9I9D955_CUCME
MKEIFPRGDAIRLDIVKMFNKRYINEEEHYTMVKGQIFDFGIEAINELFGLEANEIGHAIFKNLQERDLEDILKRIAWPETRWDILPTRVSLFPHNLNTEANIWLVFVKKKMMPTLHDNTISIEPILHRIIIVRKNKAKLKHLKTKQYGKVKVEKMDDEAEDEKEEEEAPLKRKRQGEEEASRSKRAKSSKTKDYKDTLMLASTKSLKKKKPT